MPETGVSDTLDFRVEDALLRAPVLGLIVSRKA
jgi:hypothetical protein